VHHLSATTKQTDAANNRSGDREEDELATVNGRRTSTLA
jgi:hypothetical protein